MEAERAVKDLGARLLAANQELARLRHELHDRQEAHDTLLRLLLGVLREHGRPILSRLWAACLTSNPVRVHGDTLREGIDNWHLITNPIEGEDVVELRAEYAEPVVEPVQGLVLVAPGSDEPLL